MAQFTIAALSAAGVGESVPFVGVVAGALRVPLTELYALLWRAGLLDIGD